MGVPLRTKRMGITEGELIPILHQTLHKREIKVHYNFEVTDIFEYRDGVMAFERDGQVEGGAFLIGCDGLWSQTLYPESA